MDSSIELPDDIWNYLKKFIFYNYEDYQIILRERVILQKIKLAYAADIFDNYIFKKNGIQFIENSLNISFNDLYLIYMNKVKILLSRIKELIKQKSSINSLTKVRDFSKLIIKEFIKENSTKVENLNLKKIEIEKDKIFKRIHNLFMDYSLYFN